MSYLDIAVANETIQTTDIKGKEYAEVNQRIKAFRMIYPDGSITTEMLSNDNGVCIFKAIISDKDGRVLGTGTAYEKEDSSFINKTSYIENCETSAVGRALGMCGFGIDVSVASAEEVANAIHNQEPTQEEADNYVMEFGKYKGTKLKDIPTDYIEWLLANKSDPRLIKLIELATGLVIPGQEEQEERLFLINEIQKLCDEKNVDLEEVKDKFKVDSLIDMTTEQLNKCVKALERK
jgi:uncharacterized protein (DUF3820 family)